MDSLLSVDVTAMANVDDEHKQFLVAHEIHDAIASDPVGIPPLEFTLERFALMRIAPQIIQGTGDPLIERGFPFRHPADHALGLIGEFELIGGQGKL